ncbi:M1 family metallopeptidase [Arthrobacter sp. H20]|uniref:M1 family metallopeptidase n=1 Tax=Arthrobacter sp. H20 TaxID=1267981 RepID=UPI0004B1A2E3|nr:M1 family metallopeptidase [Arthrobacter sp. H20]
MKQAIRGVAARSVQLPDPYTPGHGSAHWTALHYDLDLDYRLASNRLAARAVVTGRAAGAASQLLRTIELDLVGLKVTKVSLRGGRILRFSARGSRLVVTPSAPISGSQEFTLEIRYSGNPTPTRSTWGEVGWEELTDGVLVAGQPTGGPSWFPCNDHPSQKATYRMAVTTDTNYRAICNGQLVSHTPKASRGTWVYDQPEPMATYLATVQIGRYQLDRSGAGLVPQFSAAPVGLRDATRRALVRQPEMMSAFADLFGPYPFETYTVVVADDVLEIPLEAQSLSILGRNHLGSDWESQRLIAHELSHQWFGNSLTIDSWRDIWLHEGFACYAEWLWSEKSGALSSAQRATEAWRLLAAEPQDLAIGDPGAADMFDDRVYKRGALALHALRAATGDHLFFAVLREWTTRFRHGSVSTADLIDLAQELCGGVRGFDAAALLEPWLYQTALPNLPPPRPVS